MSIIEQIKQVIAYAAKEAEFACVHHYRYDHLDEIASRLSAIVEQMYSTSAEQNGAKPVAWRTEHDTGYMLWDDYKEALLYCDVDVEPEPLYATSQVPDGMVPVSEVLLRQIAKWLAESADTYGKAAFAIDGILSHAGELK